MVGANPLYLTTGYILEEGMPYGDLERVVCSMAETAKEAGVEIVAGDTKVVERGSADKIFINTAGIGWIPEEVNLSPGNIRPGDRIIVSGGIGDHGMAILCLREGLEFSTSSSVVRPSQRPCSDDPGSLSRRQGDERPHAGGHGNSPRRVGAEQWPGI
jgi:hydrogenase expression/formation protein HypE